MCEQAEHVKLPQEMEYDVTMKTRTNLCRNIGVHTKPLNWSRHSIKNVSCGSFYNTETEKCTSLIEMYYSHSFQLFIFHIWKSYFHFQFSLAGFYRTQYPASYTHKSLDRTPQFTLPASAGTQTCLLFLFIKIPNFKVIA